MWQPKSIDRNIKPHGSQDILVDIKSRSRDVRRPREFTLRSVRVSSGKEPPRLRCFDLSLASHPRTLGSFLPIPLNGTPALIPICHPPNEGLHCMSSMHCTPIKLHVRTFRSPPAMYKSTARHRHQGMHTTRHAHCWIMLAYAIAKTRVLTRSFLTKTSLYSVNKT